MLKEQIVIMARRKVYRCVLCSFEISKRKAEKDKIKECPNCNTRNPPLDSELDIRLKINWHELRLLCMWAERYAVNLNKAERTTEYSAMVYWIAERLMVQFPELHNQSPLTLADEISKIKEQGFRIETSFPGIEE